MQLTSKPLHWVLERGRALAALSLRASAIVLLAGFASASLSNVAWGAEPDMVARVNDEPVSRADLQRMLADPLTQRLYRRELGVPAPEDEALARWALRKLIIQRLTLQEAARRSFTVAEQDLDQAVAAWRIRLKTAAKFQKWLKSRSVDEKSLRELIRTDLLVTRVRGDLAKEARLTDEQVQEYYAAHKDELKVPEEVRLRIITAKNERQVKKFHAALRKDQRVAQADAQDTDTGWSPLNDFPPLIQQAVAGVKPGKISAPLRGGAGEYVLVRLEGRRPARTKTLAEARPEIEKRLLPGKQQEAVQTWLTQQEMNASIELVDVAMDRSERGSS